jgi:hypothetical protein
MSSLKTIDLEIVSEKVPAVPERKHHLFGPSRMAYLRECAGFTNRQRGSAAADEGTMMHEIMESLIVNVADKKTHKTLTEQLDNLSQELTEEQLGCIRFCCQHVDKFLVKKPSAIYHEVPIEVRRANGKELNHGHLDLFMVFGKTGILIDFKFGRVAVTPARENLQGWNYMLGEFQAMAGLDRIGVCFLQPRTNSASHHMFERGESPRLLRELEKIIDFAMEVQAKPAEAHKFLNPGRYCEYCALSGSCTAQANMRGAAVATIQKLPMPTAFTGLELTKPEDIALARYWVQVLEPAFEEVKKRAKEIAELSGGEIKCKLPNGEEVVYEMAEKRVDRSLGSTMEIQEAFKENITIEEVLAISDLPLGKFQKLIENSLVENAKLQGTKLTKTKAWEQAQSTLEALGLITQPDGKVRYLRLQKNTNKPKQIES